MTQQTIAETTAELAVAAADHARDAVISLRQAAMAKIGELIAFEDDLPSTASPARFSPCARRRAP